MCWLISQIYSIFFRAMSNKVFDSSNRILQRLTLSLFQLGSVCLRAMMACICLLVCISRHCLFVVALSFIAEFYYLTLLQRLILLWYQLGSVCLHALMGLIHYWLCHWTLFGRYLIWCHIKHTHRSVLSCCGTDLRSFACMWWWVWFITDCVICSCLVVLCCVAI